MKKRKGRLLEGLPVIDANQDINLHITPKDIKNSRKNDPANCAAARAGSRILKTEVRVFLTRTYVKQKKNWVRFITPETISREITAFERGASFEPGEYTLKAPNESSRLGHHIGGKNKEKTHKKSRAKYHATGMVRKYK